MDGRKLLEELQEFAWLSRQVTLPRLKAMNKRHASAALLRTPPSMAGTTLDSLLTLPTRWESLEYWTWTRSLNFIIEAAEKFRFESGAFTIPFGEALGGGFTFKYPSIMGIFPSRPLVGTLPTGKFNARAIAGLSNDELLLVFESGLPLIIADLAHIAASMLTYFKVEEGDAFKFSEDDAQRLAQKHHLAARLVNLLCQYVQDGYIATLPQFPHVMEESASRLAWMLFGMAMSFVCAHEFSHVLADHHAWSKTSTTTLGRHSILEFEENWEHELEADHLGAWLSKRAFDTEDGVVALQFVGPSFFFACARVVEKASLALGKGNVADSINSGHPPLLERISHHKEFLYDWLYQGPAESIYQLCETVAKPIEFLYNQVEREIREIKVS